jgi:hypothetical protein
MNKKDQQALDELRAYIASRTEKTNRQSDKHILSLNTLEVRSKLSANGKQPKSIVHAENVRKANIGLKKSSETKDKIGEAQIGNRKRCKPLVTKFGIFLSLKEAGEYALNQLGIINAHAKLRNWVKTDKDNFYEITKEEYIRLTGENPWA